MSQTRSASLDLNRSPPKSTDGSALGEGSNDIGIREHILESSLQTSQRFDDTVSHKKGAEVLKDSQKHRTRYLAMKEANPKLIKEINHRTAEKRKERIADLSEEELKKFIKKKREYERIRYHARKREGGCANQFESKLKDIRRKIRQKIATPEEIAIREKNLERKRISYHKLKNNPKRFKRSSPK